MQASIVAIPQPWERRTGESARAFSYFLAFRDLAPRARTAKNTAAVLGLSTNTVNDHMQRHRWRERAEAYDAYLERVAREAREREIEESNRFGVQLGTPMQGAALTRLVGRNAVVDENGNAIEAVVALDPNDLDAAAVARIAETGFRIARTALGLPTDLTKSLDALTPAEAQMIFGALVELALEAIERASSADAEECALIQDAFVRDIREIGRR
ncbi:MAG: hypothetical protein ACYDA3_13490 [Gaiellaceae bacterium]